jgi:cell division initiation protein
MQSALRMAKGGAQMAVTIQMIGEKEFKMKAHGYDQEELDEFLDEISDEFEAMENEIRDLRARVAAMPAAVETPAPVQPARSESPSLGLQEESVKNMLVNAQRVCEETIANAQSRAEELVVDARDQAERLLADARGETQRLQDQMETLRASAADYRARFQRLVDDQAQVLKGDLDLFRKVK